MAVVGEFLKCGLKHFTNFFGQCCYLRQDIITGLFRSFILTNRMKIALGISERDSGSTIFVNG